MCFLQMTSGFLGIDRLRLQQNNAGDNLEAVGYAVLDFVQQDILLPQQFILFMLQGALSGDILDAEQDDIRVRASLVEHLAGIQEHCTGPDIGKVMIDFIIFHFATLGYDFSEEQAKLWNVPRTVSKIEQEFPLGFVAVDLECQIEGTARGDHAKFVVKHYEWLSNGVYDRMCERISILDVSELFSEHNASLRSHVRTGSRTRFRHRNFARL